MQLSASDFVGFDPSLLVRSWVHLGTSLSVLNFLSLGPFLLFRFFTRIDSAFLLCGMFQSGSSQSLLDMCHADALLSPRSSLRSNSPAPIFGLPHFRSIFSLPVVDIMQFRSSVSTRSLVRLGLVLLAIDSADPSMSLALQSFP